MVVLLAGISSAQNYSVGRYVIASGGGHSESASYQTDGTAGQPIVGQSSSANYAVDAGFWAGVGEAGGGCDYVVGDVNGSSSYNGLDITYGVAFFKGGPDPMCPFGSCPTPPCDGFFYCGDVNGSCSYNGLDITYGVSYLKGGPGPLPCSSCAPPGVVTAIQKNPGIAGAK